MSNTLERAEAIADKYDNPKKFAHGMAGAAQLFEPITLEKAKHEAAGYIRKHIRNKAAIIAMNGKPRQTSTAWLIEAAKWRRLAQHILNNRRSS